MRSEAAVRGGLEEHVHPTYKRPRGVVQWRWKGHDGKTSAIGPLGDPLDAPNGSVLFQRDGHGTSVVGHGRAVQLVQTPRHTPLVLAQRGAATRKDDSSLVVERDVPFRIGRVDRCR